MRLSFHFFIHNIGLSVTTANFYHSLIQP